MGLTAHNRKRREMEAKGQGGEVTRAQAEYDAAHQRLYDLVDKTAVAEKHLEAMEARLKAAKAKGKPAKTPKKKTSKKTTAKKGK